MPTREPSGISVGSTTWPTTLARISHLSHTAFTAAKFSGVTMASMRSWLSEVMISKGAMPSSRWGTASTFTSMPTPPLAAVSQVAQISPAPPKSWMPTTSSRSSSSRQASMSRFSS